MEVSGQLHAPTTLPPGKEPLVLIGKEARWAPEPFCNINSKDFLLSVVLQREFICKVRNILYQFLFKVFSVVIHFVFCVPLC
jgi:hypothetical protein